MPQTNAELIAWAFERLDAKDLDAMRTIWNADTIERFPDATCRGADELAAYFEVLFAALPDMRMEVRSIGGDGDDVYVHWHLSGTHSGGPFSGIAPTDKAIAVDGIDHFVVRDGIVVSNFVVFDQMQFARDIGMLPPDGSRADRAAKAAFNARSRLIVRLRLRRGR